MTAPTKTVAAKVGLLLVNLGSPASPERKDVGQWLNQFLMDPKVINLPWLLRKLLVSGIIVPLRTRRIAANYSSIWTDQGSPLLINTAHLAQAIATKTKLPVVWASRYGQPNINSGLQKLAAQGVNQVLVVPLYPQYAMSTTSTALEEANRCNSNLAQPVQLLALPPFYQDDGYIDCLAASVKTQLSAEDYLLISYHGLPERHLPVAAPANKGHCLATANCCEGSAAAHATCYLHQAKVTSQKLVQRLNLPAQRWQMSFQSRLGRTPWLQPYTDQVLAALPAQGIKNLAVVCPAFVADNFETLEEINIRGREQFMTMGGENYAYVPCLNNNSQWVASLARLCLQALSGRPIV